MKKRWIVWIGLLVALISVSTLASGQGFPLGLLPTPTQSDKPLIVGVWTEEPGYELGDALTLFYSVNQPAFIYLFDLQPDGIVRLLFPNVYSQYNYVAAGTHRLPDGEYELTIAPPTGVEELLIFASLTPIGLDPTAYSGPFPIIASDPSEAMYQLQSLMRAMTPLPSWATGWTAFTISGPSFDYEPPASDGPIPPFPPAYPPYPSQPGDAWYWQAGTWHAGLPTSGWYWYFGLDARWHLCLPRPEG
ncbi:DUF4384 domain-containing protein [Candidatus Bipolaricaulota bacterium]|nr:DUF4384 domain-containing protein [Candidatus Bipolaricaulota bacterium]